MNSSVTELFELALKRAKGKVCSTFRAEMVPMLTRTTDRVAQYLAALERLAPLIAEHRHVFDGDRRLSDTVFKALADAGLFRLWLPEKLGGPGLSPLQFMEIVEAASALDGSVGWLVGNGGGMSRAGGYLPEPVAREWFSNPHAFIVAATGAVGKAEPAAGGYRVSGRWPFGSGAHHATQFMGLSSATRADGSEEPPICCYFSRADVVVHDNWYVSGLRGTGSCDFEVKDVLVPFAHTHPLTDFQPTQPGVVYRLPGRSVFPWTVATVPLGIAAGAMNAFRIIASKKARAGSTLRDSETVQLTMGRVEAIHSAGRAFLIDAMTHLVAALDEDTERLRQARITFRLACAHAGDSAIRIANLLAREASTASIVETGTLERSIRDIHAATKHIAMNSIGYTMAGRLSLGLDPGTRF
jgi:alkylation response protein AidB-like acyl-CoA dehydrogenase